MNKIKYTKIIKLSFILISMLFIFVFYSKIPQHDKAQIVHTIKEIPTEPVELSPITLQNYTITKNNKILDTINSDNKKIVLLTIDDGPSNQSEDILKILEENNVKALFFINGERHGRHPKIINKVHNMGHVVGNHTWNHANMSKISEEEIKIEIDKTSDLIKKETGEMPKFFRFPYGKYDAYTKDYITEKGMTHFNWSSSALDWEAKSRDKNVFIQNILNTLEDGSIILIHEHPWSRDALPDLITIIKEKGYTFVDPKYIME